MTTEEKLADAEAKYHKLVVGTAVRVFVDQNGERVEFTATTRASLLAYIQELKRQLGVAVSQSWRPFF